MDGAFRRALRGESARWGGAEWAKKPISPRIAIALRWLLLGAAIVTPLWMTTTQPSRIRTAVAASNRPMPTNLAMTNPSLSGAFADGRRYQIIAESAQMDHPDAPVIRLFGIRAATATESGERLDIVANNGAFNRLENRISLVGNVIANQSDGYEIRSEQAEIWNQDGAIAARTLTTTDITGPEGAARSAALEARPGLKSIQLIGPVKVRLKGGEQ